MTAAFGLEPDMLVCGKAIGGGVPVGTYGMSSAVADRVRATVTVEDSDVGGIGGTLAGNSLSLAAVRATLGEVLTKEAFERMIPLAARWEAGVNDVIAANDAPWHVTRLGCRAEYHFLPSPPRTGAEQWAAGDTELERYSTSMRSTGHPPDAFHNMAPMCPATTEADVDRHTEAFGEAAASLFSAT
jgi:glutamate-1-semialdehyde aminotransferase